MSVAEIDEQGLMIMGESASDDFWEESDAFLAEAMKAWDTGNSYRLADLSVYQLARMRRQQAEILALIKFAENELQDLKDQDPLRVLEMKELIKWGLGELAWLEDGVATQEAMLRKFDELFLE
jgi:hypothetical protein